MSSAFRSYRRLPVLMFAALLCHCGPSSQPAEGQPPTTPTQNEIVSGTVRMEAETMTRTGYDIQSASFASGGAFVRVPASAAAGAQGRATKAFPGPTGQYRVRVRYADEADGASQFTLRIGGTLVGEWTANQNTTGSSDPIADVFRTHTVSSNRTVNANDTVELTGTLNGGEYGRVDYVEFIPLSAIGLDSRPSNTTCLAPARPPAAGAAKLERVFPNITLSAPMVIAQAPGDSSKWYVAQRNGTVVSFPVSAPNDANKTTVLTLPNPVNTSGEGGLLGMAFHPNFAQNGHIYLSYTTTGGATGMRSVVGRMTSTNGGASFGSYTDVIPPFDQPYTNHNGGDAHFGTDGYLYLSFGDGGSGGDPLNNGQKTTTFFSKILRIDVNNPSGGRAYGIPASNPFAAGGGEPAAFAYGFRNPFRFSIDRATGEVWVGDVGQSAYEEVDKVVAGGNYGWRYREGKHCYNPSTNCPTAGLIDPVWEYPRSQGQAITGGVVYRGSAMPSLVGTYIFADYVSGNVWALRPDDNGVMAATELDNGGGGSWVAFGEDHAGEVYALSISGQIYKLVPATTPPASTFPDLLSKTGCFDATDAKIPAPGLIPYKVRSPLWSDGAVKERYLAIPNGTTITVDSAGDFDLPIGSVTVKTFYLGNTRVETRLFVRHADGGWAGYSYEWNAAQTDATLLPSSKTKTIGGQTWYFPSRSECLSCHTAAAGRTLGLEVQQLNTTQTYPATGRTANQLNTLEGIELIAGGLSATPENLPALPDPLGTTALEGRARSYLHANCSMCHRPQGPGGGGLDLLYSTPFAATNTCGTSPQHGTLGIANAKIIAPGSAATSLLVQRPNRLGAGRMPPLASNVVDTSGVSVLTSWVNGLTSCP